MTDVKKVIIEGLMCPCGKQSGEHHVEDEVRCDGCAASILDSLYHDECMKNYELRDRVRVLQEDGDLSAEVVELRKKNYYLEFRVHALEEDVRLRDECIKMLEGENDTLVEALMKLEMVVDGEAKIDENGGNR